MEVDEQAILVPRINESDFFKYCQENNLFEPNDPGIETKMVIEEWVDGWEVDDPLNDAWMHIIVAYKNIKGSTLHYHIKTPVRPSDRFDLDEHLSESQKLLTSLLDGATDRSLYLSTMSVVNHLILESIGLSQNAPATKEDRANVYNMLGAYLTAIFRDPKVVFVNVSDRKFAETTDSSLPQQGSLIDFIWTVKKRH